MRKCLDLLCLVILLATVSSSFALDPMLIGDFESGESSTGRYDYWYGVGTSATDVLVLDDVTVPLAAATRGTHSLKVTSQEGGWGPGISFPVNELENKFDIYALAADDGAVLGFDVTFETVPDGLIQVGYFTNNGAGVDPTWAKDGWVDVPGDYLDGYPHTLALSLAPLQESLLHVVDTQNDGGYYNIGIVFSTGQGPLTVYIDNIWIFPDGLINTYGPYSPSVAQDFNASDPDFVDFILHWKAGQDPGGYDPDPNVVYPVNPAIVDEYVFRSNGSDADPNLYYLGATGVDPGMYDPNSEYGPVLLPINSRYAWTVVEAIEGYEQTFITGFSTLEDVDPNNIIGPIWTFPTLSTIPVIDTQPESARFGINDASVQFTLEVSSNTPPSYQWYYSKDAVRDAGDNAIGSSLGGDTDTLTITAHNKAYQAYYYCRVANQSTVSGGGTEPDVYSDIVSLVVDRKVAQYLFDGNLNDTSGEGNNGTGVGAPTFATGVGGSGSALSLNGSTQYVELGNSADPNTFNKCFPRADLLAKDGIGGGLDAGTIMCWIQLDVTAANQVSPIMNNANAGWPHTAFQFEINTDSTAANTNVLTAIWGDDEILTMVDVNPVWADPFSMGGDGQWHMLASVWDRTAGTMKAYLDGNLLATWGSEPSVFSAWDSTMTIGFDGTNYFDGLIDNLRVYNYEVAAEDIAQEYYNVTGNPACIYLNFPGSSLNADNTGSSYCKVDLADFAVLAQNWLADGFYPID